MFVFTWEIVLHSLLTYTELSVTCFTSTKSEVDVFWPMTF